MRFEVEGRLHGHHMTLTWERGTLTGPEWAVKFFHDMSESLRNQVMGYHKGPHLDHAVNAMVLICDMMDEVDEVRGQIPGPEKAPKGAIN